MAEQTSVEVAENAFRFLEAILTGKFASATEEQAQVWIDCMEGDICKGLAVSLWNMERTKRAIAAKAAAHA